MTSPLTAVAEERLREIIDTARSYIGANGYDPDPEEIIAIAESLLARRSPVPEGDGLRVKALEWCETISSPSLRGGSHSYAGSILGVYRVWGDGSWTVDAAGAPFVVGFGTIDDANAAGTKLVYTARILSALASPAPVKAEAEVVAFEFTPEQIADLYGGEIVDRWRISDSRDAVKLIVQQAIEHDRRHATPSSGGRREALEGRRGIYIASKVAHAQRWRILRDKVGFPIVSTWIDEAGPGESTDLSDLWRRCIEEAATAEVLVINREPPEILKGGWIELGAALACGVPVLATGIEEFTVAHDKRIRHFPDMPAIMEFLKPMVNGVPYRALANTNPTGAE